MTEWKDRAIILRIGHFRESDLWVKALLASQGLCTLFAFGGAKSRRRFCGCLDVLNSISCSIRLSRNGEFMDMREAALLEAPVKLRENWRAMGMAANCMLFVEALGIGPDSSAECFALTEDMRRAFEQYGARYPMLPMFFRLRMAAALGFAPDFGLCCRCGGNVESGAFFQVSEGRLFCLGCGGSRGCFSQGGLVQKLDSASLELLKRVQSAMPTQWRPDLFGAADIRQCARAIDGFVQYHIGLEWDNGYFHQV